MNQYLIRGGRPLFGEITISGAKNAAVAIIPAALLVDGTCRIGKHPADQRCYAAAEYFEELGARSGC